MGEVVLVFVADSDDKSISLAGQLLKTYQKVIKFLLFR